MDLEKRAIEVEEKLKSIRKKIAKRDAEKRKSERLEKEKKEIRKKMLIATFILEDTNPVNLQNGRGQTFEKWLKAPEDREIFGFDKVS